jgi:hypothetical protein
MMSPFVLVYPDFLSSDEADSKIWYDQSDMPLDCHHWMFPIRRALACYPRMRVDVRNHGQSRLSAEPPKFAISSSVEHHHARIEAPRIEIVIEHKAFDTPLFACTGSEEESSTFPPPPTTTPKLSKAVGPNLRSAAEMVFRSHEVPYNRSN